MRVTLIWKHFANTGHGLCDIISINPIKTFSWNLPNYFLVHHKTTWDKLDLIVCILFQGTEGKYLAIYDKSEAGVQVSRLLSVVPMMLRYFY